MVEHAGALVTQWILASDGQPFRDRDAALIKRDLLVAELGQSVQLDVVTHPAGGFAVSVRHGKPVAAETAAPAPREALKHLIDAQEHAQASTRIVRAAQFGFAPSANDATTTAATSFPEVFRLSPAIRAYPGLHLQAVLGATLLLRPHWLFALMGMHLPSGTAGAVVLGIAACCGALLSMIALSRFLWAYTSNTYVVDGLGVEQIQWYFDKGRLRRRAPRLNFGHLRSVDVDQSLIQMALNVGSLKLASGAIDSYEVVLHQISSPRALQREFQRRLQQASAAGQRGREHNEL